MTCSKITIAEINEKVRSALDAFEAGDYSAAEKHAFSVEMMLIAKPDTEFSKEKLMWDREAVGKFTDKVSKFARANSSSNRLSQITVRRDSTCS